MIEYYTDAPTINVENKDELFEAIDILHTQVMDNIGEESPLLRVLEKCMHEISESEG
jgi:hypothetical protein